MGKHLVIVESPAKAKTINKYLGRDYVVRSSIGHIRDLPVSGAVREKGEGDDASFDNSTTQAGVAAVAGKRGDALFRRMGVYPQHNWEADYVILPGKEKVLAELQELAAKAESIILATDLDREGEAIAWHLREAIGGDASRYRRVTFAEITQRAIQEAFAKAGELDMDRVNAQQARRFLDRVVGFMLSPLLWKKVARGLSAGRVQSVAVRLVVEREREIRAFIPDEYWEIAADLAQDGRGSFGAQVVKAQGQPFKPVNKAQADAALADLKGAAYQIVARDDKPRKNKPYPPFITSSLQAAASTRLNFSVKKTMTMAQRLYEAGYITYMRTDSTNLSRDAVEACRAHIEHAYGARYLPEQPQVYTSRDSAQEAHEAIRPSDVRVTEDDLKDAEADAVRLYQLIRNQFIACQMPPAEFDTTTVQIQAGSYELRASGRVLRFDGWLKVLPPQKGDDEEGGARLPDLAVGPCTLKALKPTQHFTKPPPRFSEAALVKELEKRGIGRPSTYAAIIATIQERGYVRLDKRRFYAEKMGEIVTVRLSENFQELLDYGFTAQLEERLDEVAEGKQVWKKVLDRFWQDFTAELAKADDAMRKVDAVETDISCAKCGRPMQIRTARTGVFLSCSGYGLSKNERCTATVNLVPGVEAVDADADADSETRALREKKRCPICSTAMDAWLVDATRKLHICGNNPECSGSLIETGSFRIKGYEGPTIECDKCGKPMQLKTGRFGKYFGCTGYPECTNTRKLLRSGEAAPPKSAPVPMPELQCTKGPGHFVLRDGAVGLFLAASTYPKVRETRNPLVADLKRHRDELVEKYHFLADGPESDAQGNAFVIRFSRKTKDHYLSAEADGTPTTLAYYVDGKWVQQAAKASDAPKKKAPAKRGAKAKG